jgi:EmrB/QacA subfamily drug resistance transporter
MSATVAGENSARRSSGELTHRQILTIMSGLMLAMFLASLDQMIVSTAIRTIGDDLNGLSVQAWVTTGFLITSTITTPLYGKLSDIYGRKPLFLFAIATFIIGSALCGLSTSMYMLAGFRALQGVGAGGLISMALAIMGDIIPPRERARYQGYFMAVFATSSVLGPVVGGFFAGQSSIFGVTGWRWIFYVNVPIGILALIVVTRVLRPSHHHQQHRIDWMGATALIVGLVPLLIVAEQGRTWGWGSVAAFACYIVGVFGLIAFVKVEQIMGDDALLPLRIFRNGTFSLGSAQSFIIGIGMFGGLACIPLYLQIVKGASPTKAGLLLLPMVVGIMSSSLLAGQVTSRTGHYRQFPSIGSALLVTGLALLSTVGADTALWHTDLFMLTFGLGLGMNMQTLVLAMQNVVEPKDMGVATASVTFFRQVGGTLGTAAFLSILFSSAGHNISSQYTKAASTPAFQNAVHAHPDQLKAISGGGNLNDTAFLKGMDGVISHPFLVGFSHAMDTVFLTGAIVLVIALVISVFMKEVPLRTQSGLQAARAALAAEDPSTPDPGGATHDAEPVSGSRTG